MQPYFLPHLGYFQLVAAADKFVIYDDVSFINGGWINRNRILLNRAPYMFTVPLQGASQNRLICDIGLVPDARWREKTLRTIALSYRKAPCYLSAMPVLEQVFRYQTTQLVNLVSHSLQVISQYIGIDTELQPTSRIYENRQLCGQDRILDICKLEGAEVYVNAPGGRHLYDHATFAANGIQLKFLASMPVTYDQMQAEFCGSLSIIDVLMFNNLQAIQKMLGKYELL